MATTKTTRGFEVTAQEQSDWDKSWAGFKTQTWMNGFTNLFITDALKDILGGLNCSSTPTLDPVTTLSPYCDFAYEQYVQIGVMVGTYLFLLAIFVCYMGVGVIGKLIIEDWGIWESWIETVDSNNEDLGTSIQYYPSMLASTKAPPTSV